ncbi:phage major capsid protein [Corynebacterium sp. P5848]|uniref:phage major capsid protein n=1 Tax=Corynebacterium marambiense TaxID=2765364 RepID=UPI0022608F33|nr:phage major capsid protein [Corynebacterium marambiense]MCX7542304.1 phage major capsid protein [Corynebacterium marambiense]
MPQFNTSLARTDVADALMPDVVSKSILQTTPQQSVVMSMARSVPMSAKKTKQPVLATLPDAYWVDGDTGMKQTSKATWKNVTMTAEELAVIVPIPDAVVDDANIPLWDEIKPLLAEAIGRAVDNAVLFGVDKPASWPEALVPAATAAGNTVVAGTGKDIGVDIAELARKVSVGGFNVNGFASEPGLNWELIGLRTEQGNPIYGPSMAQGQPSTLYGKPIGEVLTGIWPEAVPSTGAKLIAADWSKIVIGRRQDITYDLFSEGVISDSDGKVILNLMQQDMKALRVVMRLGYQVANPMTRLQKDESKRFPAGVLFHPAAG